MKISQLYRKAPLLLFYNFFLADVLTSNKNKNKWIVNHKGAVSRCCCHRDACAAFSSLSAENADSKDPSHCFTFYFYNFNDGAADDLIQMKL